MPCRAFSILRLGLRASRKQNIDGTARSNVAIQDQRFRQTGYWKERNKLDAERQLDIPS